MKSSSTTSTEVIRTYSTHFFKSGRKNSKPNQLATYNYRKNVQEASPVRRNLTSEENLSVCVVFVRVHQARYQLLLASHLPHHTNHHIQNVFYCEKFINTKAETSFNVPLNTQHGLFETGLSKESTTLVLTTEVTIT